MHLSKIYGAMMLVLAASVVAKAQLAPDAAYPGSGLNRQQIMDKLTAADYTSTPSVADGKLVFENVCSGCHIFGDLGAAVGPDLSTVASRFKKKDILDSILWPSRTISDQYVMVTLTLDDGTTESGLVTREDANFVYLRNAAHMEGRGLPIAAARIKDRKDSTVSMMPEGLMAPLKLTQIDNLVAFLLIGK